MKAWNYILEAFFQCEGESISFPEKQHHSNIPQSISSLINEMQDLKFEQFEQIEQSERFCLVWYDEPSKGCMVKETLILEHLQKEGK
jgi:hypothetical protein